MESSVLVIYTGGTIGMKQNPATGALVPFDFAQIEDEVPELKKFQYKIDTHSFKHLVDSSDMQPAFWGELAKVIYDNYEKYVGFVVLHGTDTMSYSASAVSFMLENLAKPVIFTGSQLPIGVVRTDGKENILASIEIAAAQKDGKAIVPEVCIFFESKLFRGNRTTKHSAENFNAFRSYNYPALAESGVEIKYNTAYIVKPEYNKAFRIRTGTDNAVIGLKIFPGISPIFIGNILKAEGLRGVVIETFGSGNAPTSAAFLKEMQDAVNRGIIILNISQCRIGRADMDKYETGMQMKKTGVVSGGDMTFEAAITKMIILLAEYGDNNQEIKKKLTESLRGEITV